MVTELQFGGSNVRSQMSEINVIAIPLARLNNHPLVSATM